MDHTPKYLHKILSLFLLSGVLIYFLKVNSKLFHRSMFRISLLCFHLSFSLSSLIQLSFKLSPEDTITYTSRLSLLNSLHFYLKLCQLGVRLLNHSFLLLFEKFFFFAKLEKRLLNAEHVVIYR